VADFSEAHDEQGKERFEGTTFEGELKFGTLVTIL
jgi:hypothetical protein